VTLVKVTVFAVKTEVKPSIKFVFGIGRVPLFTAIVAFAVCPLVANAEA
jgi:ABC-type proline/glycine betaine transport system permease subunit